MLHVLSIVTCMHSDWPVRHAPDGLVLHVPVPCSFHVATADPAEVVDRAGVTAAKVAPPETRVDAAARSLTRSLARSAAPSPLVQLLARHRQSRCWVLPGFRMHACACCCRAIVCICPLCMHEPAAAYRVISHAASVLVKGCYGILQFASSAVEGGCGMLLNVLGAVSDMQGGPDGLAR
jgi:hypothetical protein